MNKTTSEHLFCAEHRDCKRTCCGTLIDEVSTFVAINGSGPDVHACPEVISIISYACNPTNGKSKDSLLNIQKLCPASSR